MVAVVLAFELLWVCVVVLCLVAFAVDCCFVWVWLICLSDYWFGALTWVFNCSYVSGCGLFAVMLLVGLLTVLLFGLFGLLMVSLLVVFVFVVLW